MNFSISQMDSMQRSLRALRRDMPTRFERKAAWWSGRALMQTRMGRQGGSCWPISSASGRKREVQGHHPLEIVGQRVPEQHGARLHQPTHGEALQTAVAQMRVGALDAGRSLLVAYFGGA